jgi:hypothetical protein
MATMKEFATQSLALILTCAVLIIGFPIVMKLLFTIGPVALLVLVVGVLLAMAMK